MFLKEFFEKVDFEKKFSNQLKHEKIPSVQRVHVCCLDSTCIAVLGSFEFAKVLLSSVAEQNGSKPFL